MLILKLFSDLPQELLTATFGRDYTTLYSIRILLCRAIDEARSRNVAKVRIGFGDKAGSSHSITSSLSLISEKAKVLIKKKIPTTPQSVLDILQTLEKKKEPKKFKASNHKALDWATTKAVLMEAKEKRVKAALPQNELNMTREEIIAGLAFV